MSDSAPAIGLLTYCVNDLTIITDGERSLLREMLAAAHRNALREWGQANLPRALEVRRLFDKIKAHIHAASS